MHKRVLIKKFMSYHNFAGFDNPHASASYGMPSFDRDRSIRRRYNDVNSILGGNNHQEYNPNIRQRYDLDAHDIRSNTDQAQQEAHRDDDRKIAIVDTSIRTCDRPTQHFNGGTCGICQETFELKDMLQYSECGHVFCEDCLLRWTKRSDSCPLDRTPSNVCKPIGRVIDRIDYAALARMDESLRNINRTLHKRYRE
jgi:hypothetical protein